MMKKVFCAAAAALLLLCSACSQASPAGSGTPLESDVSKTSSSGQASSSPDGKDEFANLTISDKTVDRGQFYPTGEETILYNAVSPRGDYDIMRTVQELNGKATHIVYGMVDKAGFLDDSASGPQYAGTVYDFIVWKSYKGGLQPGDKITVDAPGGCQKLREMVDNIPEMKEKYADLTAEEIDNTLLASLRLNIPLAEAGDVCVLFLSNRNYENEDEPFDYYREVDVPRSCYVKGNDGKFKRLVPLDNPNYFDRDPIQGKFTKISFTLDEIEAEIAACQ